MKTKKSLRHRLIITTVLIVTVTSALFAGGVLLLKQNMEEVTFGRSVSEHLQILKQNSQAARELMHPVFGDWRFIVGDDVQELPEHIQALLPGSYHSVRIKDNHYQLEVAEYEGDKAFLLYDITEWEHQEHQLLLSLLGGVLVVLILALLMATSAANSILSPIRKLTARLTLIDPDQRNIRIAEEFEDRDIGQIAKAFDAYAARIDQFVDRERSFTASASHELRTPLSVMMGAVDVIEANQPPPAIQRAVQRIQRACGEMQGFIEATLLLSREQQRGINTTAATDLGQILKQLLENNQDILSRNHITVETNFEADQTIDAPESIVKMTVGNLLRNAIEHTPGGTIHIHLSKGQLLIRDNGEGIKAENLPQVFDRSFSTKASGVGLGLNMVKRICDRFDWQINIESQQGNGTVVSIVF